MNLRSLWSDFRILSFAAAAVTGALCAVLLFVPGVIYWLFQLDSGKDTDVVSRRAAMLFLGLAVICFQSRESPDSAARRAICLGMMVSMTGLATVGLYDFMRGAVGFGIWLAISVEMFFATAFSRFSR
ncbi:MAG: hypothetical protein WBB25_17150 [Sulfitobacter sp.]